MKRIIATLIIAIGFACALLALPVSASADEGFSISVDFGPPPLPYYPQPPCPGVGFIWTPGYWSYDDDDGYYWVPGSWVLAPAVGLLWTPGWWGWDDGRFWWHDGYWGRRVGYYGGIHYGHGYPGEGFDGGYWRDDDFYYNRAVDNVDASFIHLIYEQTEDDDDDWHGRRVSYNGGDGGVEARPSPEQQVYASQAHFSATESQMEQQRAARNDPAQHWAVNHGAPEIAATVRPGEFNGAGVVKMNPRVLVRGDGSTAHSNPGQPSFQRGQRIESAPAFHAVEPRVHADYQPRYPSVPAHNSFEVSPHMTRPQPIRVVVPVVHERANVTRNVPHMQVQRDGNSQHREKWGRPPY